MLSEEYKVKLKNIMYKALTKAEEHMEDDEIEEAHWCIEMVNDIDHICRKHMELESK